MGVARGQLVPNAVEQLHVALLRVLSEGRDEGPGHGAGGLRRNRGISPVDRNVSVDSAQEVDMYVSCQRRGLEWMSSRSNLTRRPRFKAAAAG